MNKVVTMDDIIPIISQKLSAKGQVVFAPKGISMYPTLVGNRDSVTLQAIEDEVKKYDIVLYKRTSGEYVLHRVIGVEKNSYVMRGDNQIVAEAGISRAQIIARVVQYNKRGVVYNCGSMKERLYSFFIVKTARMRRFYYRLRRKIGRIIHGR